MPPPTNSGNQQDQKCQIPKSNLVTFSKRICETGFKGIYDPFTSGQRYQDNFVEFGIFDLVDSLKINVDDSGRNPVHIIYIISNTYLDNLV